MLRFFRNIRQGLIMPDNFRKYLIYALGEVLLVMIGILLALQVNNWNEQRLKQIREEEYLVRLFENLQGDQVNLELRINFFKQVSEYGDQAISHYEDRMNTESDNWDILLAYFQASQIWPLTLKNDTYEELKSAGELDVIQNVQIRSILSDYYGEQYANYILTLGSTPRYRERIRGAVPFYLQDAIWENCHRTNGGTTQDLIPCSQPEYVKDSDIDDAIVRLEKEDYVYDLRFWMSNIFVGLEILENQQRMGITIQETITAELEN